MNKVLLLLTECDSTWQMRKRRQDSVLCQVRHELPVGVVIGKSIKIAGGMIKRDKTALVLAGGGLTGAVYEIGALRAIDDLLIDRTVNDFDIYVGTSAGSLVASFIANGLSPEEMLQVIDGSHPLASTVEREAPVQLELAVVFQAGP